MLGCRAVARGRGAAPRRGRLRRALRGTVTSAITISINCYCYCYCYYYYCHHYYYSTHHYYYYYYYYSAALSEGPAWREEGRSEAFEQNPTP